MGHLPAIKLTATLFECGFVIGAFLLRRIAASLLAANVGTDCLFVRVSPHSVWFENVVVLMVRGLRLQRVLQ